MEKLLGGGGRFGSRWSGGRSCRGSRGGGGGGRRGCGGSARLRRIRRPIMTAAFRADPELVWLPGRSRRRVSQIHLCATSLAADVECDVCHGRIL